MLKMQNTKKISKMKKKTWFGAVLIGWWDSYCYCLFVGVGNTVLRLSIGEGGREGKYWVLG